MPSRDETNNVTVHANADTENVNIGWNAYSKSIYVDIIWKENDVQHCHSVQIKPAKYLAGNFDKIAAEIREFYGMEESEKR